MIGCRIVGVGQPLAGDDGAGPAVIAVPLTARQGTIAMWELLMRACGGAVSPDLSMLFTLLNAGLTGGLVWCRTGAEVERTSQGDLVVEDAFVGLLQILLSAVRRDDLRARPKRRLRPRRSRALITAR